MQKHPQNNTQENMVNYTFLTFWFETLHKKWVVIKYQIGYKQLKREKYYPLHCETNIVSYTYYTLDSWWTQFLIEYFWKKGQLILQMYCFGYIIFDI